MKNERIINTAKKSVTFDDRLFAVLEADRMDPTETDRSLFLRRLFERRYYGAEVREVPPSARSVLEKIAAGKFKRSSKDGRLTVTRGISFELDMLEVFEADHNAIPSRDRSQFIAELLEERYYGQKMRPVSDSAKRVLKQIAARRR